MALPVMGPGEQVVYDYSAMSLSLKAHPVSFVRGTLVRKKVCSAADLKNLRDGAPVRVAGLMLSRQRPGKAGSICFVTIEDETGTANLIIFKNLFEKFRKEILHSRLIMVEGKVQREGEVIHVAVKTCHDYTPLLRTLTSKPEGDLPLLTLSRADERAPFQATNKRTPARFTAEERSIPPARNFQ